MSKATPAGTQAYFTRHPLPVTPIAWPKTGWSVSPIGFGGYRIHDRNPEHREALRLALTSGCNLIDTSTNYTDGGSELLVGQVLAELFQSGALRREEVIVVTKAGYIQGDNLRIAEERERDGRPFPEVVKLSPDLWHCLSPEFLEDQLARSLKRLGLSCVDVLLLHNPEYFLKADPDHAEYYRRIQQAFSFLEKQVAAGRIAAYGVSSNTFPEPKEAEEFTSLDAVLDCAEAAAKENGRETSSLAVIQFPFNLFEAGAALLANNSGKTLLELAREKGLGTLSNRPLNAFVGQRMLRLADFPTHDPEATTLKIKKGIDRLVALESRYPGGELLPVEDVAWGHMIRHNFNRLEDLHTWRNFLDYRIRPALRAARDTLAEEAPASPATEATRDWLQEYLPPAEALFEAITHHLENHAAVDADRVSRTLVEAAPALAASQTLSRKALRVYRSIAPQSCILVGMRKTRYIVDALSGPAALLAPLNEQEALHILERIEQLR